MIQCVVSLCFLSLVTGSDWIWVWLADWFMDDVLLLGSGTRYQDTSVISFFLSFCVARQPQRDKLYS